MNNKKLSIKLSPGNNHLVNILGSIDEKIENNEKLIKSLKDFFFLKCNEFFANLTEYQIKSLTEIATFTNGLPMQKYRPCTPNHLKVLKIKELGQGCCDDNSDKCSIDIDDCYIVENGDVIFSWSGTLMVELWMGEKCGLNQHLYKVTSKSYPKWFYYYWLNFYLPDFKNIASGKATTMGHIKKEDLIKSQIKVPSTMLGTEQFDTMINKIVFLNQENNKLNKLKAIYLKKFFG